VNNRVALCRTETQQKEDGLFSQNVIKIRIFLSKWVILKKNPFFFSTFFYDLCVLARVYLPQ